MAYVVLAALILLAIRRNALRMHARPPAYNGVRGRLLPSCTPVPDPPVSFYAKA